MPVQTNFLSISWGTSRGLDTGGWAICRLDDRQTGRRFRCMGGGYDMIGTVLGDWLQAQYMPRLLAISEQAHGHRAESAGRYIHYTTNDSGLYGMAVNYRERKETARIRCLTLDGGCGVESMRRVAAAIGLSLSSVVNRKGRTTGYMVTDYGSAEALKAARK